MNWFHFFRGIGSSLLFFGTCEGLRCPVCTSFAGRCDEDAKRMVTECSKEESGSCNYEGLIPRKAESRRCVSVEIKNDRFCFWNEGGEKLNCFCKKDGCDGSSEIPTKPSANPSLSCHKCKNGGCSSLDDDGDSNESCAKKGTNSCYVQFSQVGDSPVKAKRGCAAKELYATEGCRYFKSTYVRNEVNVRCACQTANCNAGGIEDWEDKFPRCPFPQCKEKETTTKATTKGQEKEITTKATTKGQEKETTTKATTKGQEKETTTKATTKGQEKNKTTTSSAPEEPGEELENTKKCQMDNCNGGAEKLGAAANAVGQALASAIAIMWLF